MLMHEAITTYLRVTWIVFEIVRESVVFHHGNAVEENYDRYV